MFFIEYALFWFVFISWGYFLPMAIVDYFARPFDLREFTECTDPLSESYPLLLLCDSIYFDKLLYGIPIIMLLFFIPIVFYFFLFFDVDFTDFYFYILLIGFDVCDFTSSYWINGGRSNIFVKNVYFKFLYSIFCLNLYT